MQKHCRKMRAQWSGRSDSLVRLFPLFTVLGTNRMRMSTKLQGPKEEGGLGVGEEDHLTLDRPCAEEQSMGGGGILLFLSI